MITMCTQIENLDYYGLVFGPDEVKGDPEAVWALLQQEMQERAGTAAAENESIPETAAEAQTEGSAEQESAAANESGPSAISETEGF